jgi:predicted RNA-binding protein with PUA-like domain
MAQGKPSYWLMKSEPETYSYADLERDKKTGWDGVRNYQARNNLQAMKKGDLALIYHSVSDKEVVGVAEVTREAYPDPDPKRKGDWVKVDVKPKKRLKKTVTLAEIKADDRLQEMMLVTHSRLSVCPVTKPHFDRILKKAETSL